MIIALYLLGIFLVAIYWFKAAIKY